MSRTARVGVAMILWLGVLAFAVYATSRDGDSTAAVDPTTGTAAVGVTTPIGSAADGARVDPPATTAPPEPVEQPEPTTAPTSTSASITATLEDGQFRLAGVVPDQETIDHLVAAAQVVYGSGATAELAIDPEVDAGPWIEGTARAITLLPIVGRGTITIDETGATIDVSSPNEALAEQFRQSLATVLGGAEVRGTVEVTDLAYPFFSARRQGDEVVVTGFLASDEAKANILEGAIAVYGDNVVDDLTVQPGLDTPFWTYTLPGVFRLLEPFPDYEIRIEDGVTSGSINAGANFDSGSAELKPETQALLGVAVAILTRDPTLGMEVAGHTDSTGGDELNQALSEARAAAVVDFLVAAGISPERLRAIGYGETRPIAPNDTVEGRTLNRRVEFIFGPAAVVLAP